MAMVLFLETSLWGSVWGERQLACMRVGMWLDKRSFFLFWAAMASFLGFDSCHGNYVFAKLASCIVVCL